MPLREAGNVVPDLRCMHTVALEDRCIWARIALTYCTRERIVLRICRRRVCGRQALNDRTIQAEHAYDVLAVLKDALHQNLGRPQRTQCNARIAQQHLALFLTKGRREAMITSR